MWQVEGSSSPCRPDFFILWFPKKPLHLLIPYPCRLTFNLARLAPTLARLTPTLARLTFNLARLTPTLARLTPTLARLTSTLARLTCGPLYRFILGPFLGQSCPGLSPHNPPILQAPLVCKFIPTRLL